MTAGGTAKDEVLSADLTIVNKKGLHARASARFVQCVERFDADVVVSKDGHSVSGESIMGLMMLGAAVGSSIHVDVRGPEADAAMAAVTGLVSGRFGEED